MAHDLTDRSFDELSDTLGDRVLAARVAKGLTVAELAAQVGVDAGTVESWEANSSEPRATRMQMIAGLLDVSVIWLMCGEDNGTTNVRDQLLGTPIPPEVLDELRAVKETLRTALDRVEAIEARLA